MRGELAALRAKMAALRTPFTERAKPSTPGISAPADLLQVPQGFENLEKNLLSKLRSFLVSLGQMINVLLREMERCVPLELVLKTPLAADRRKDVGSNGSGSILGSSAVPSTTQRPPANRPTSVKLAAAAAEATAQQRRRGAAAQSTVQKQDTM